MRNSIFWMVLAAAFLAALSFFTNPAAGAGPAILEPPPITTFEPLALAVLCLGSWLALIAVFLWFDLQHPWHPRAP